MKPQQGQMKIVNSLEIRDNEVHTPSTDPTDIQYFPVEGNSDIVIEVINGLDQNVTVAIHASDDLYNVGQQDFGLLPVTGNPLMVSASMTGIGIYHVNGNWVPEIFIALQAITSSTAGNISVYTSFREVPS